MAQRRTEALSRERIIEAAVELLDASGESGLTFRTLTERLATGPGAIYWHVANKGELLGAATDAVVTAALAVEPADSPRGVIRAVALRLFDAIDAHPWLATQLTMPFSAGRPAPPPIFECVARQVRALGVPARSQFTATSVLVHYIQGAAGQNAANARSVAPDTDRDELLDAVATVWEERDPDARAVAEQLRGHDDRAEFLAGIDLVLAGITAVHPLRT